VNYFDAKPGDELVQKFITDFETIESLFSEYVAAQLGRNDAKSKPNRYMVGHENTGNFDFSGGTAKEVCAFIADSVKYFKAQIGERNFDIYHQYALVEIGIMKVKPFQLSSPTNTAARFTLNAELAIQAGAFFLARDMNCEYQTVRRMIDSIGYQNHVAHLVGIGALTSPASPFAIHPFWREIWRKVSVLHLNEK
jgi:hypothetical protein